MSRTIDSRVVEMQFDNKQFESNVKTSMSTLDKLKRSLNMDGATKGLENVHDAAKNVNMSGLSGAVENVRLKFSALEVMAVTALVNITNSAINAGKRIVSALTIEPVSEGFAEYELKMGSIQTIMAGTGESLETVSRYLDELNVYADRTIYSFADMTSNIGKFTNAGVSLKDAVAAIQGVSNVAAVSGANTNEASRAMYNFAQALSAGYVKLIDWRSIENANMATVEFKTQLLETAVAAGTVTKSADGMYTTLNGHVFNATRNFNDVLQDQWMTTEVLVETLGKYADETTDIGKKAFAAAQDIKTITQLFDTLTEAAGSGWAQTFELIIGDFEEAKALLTEVGGVVGGFIDRTSDARNELLRFWKENGGRDDLIEAFKNSFEALGKIIKPIQEAFRDIFPPTTGKQLVALTNGLKAFTERLQIGDETADKIRRTFKGLFAVLDLIKDAFGLVFNVAGQVFSLFAGPTAGGILELTARFGDFLVKLHETAEAGNIFGRAFDKIQEIFTTVADKIKDAISRIGSAFQGFRSIDTGPLDKFSERSEKSLRPFTRLGEIFGAAFEAIVKVLEWAAPIVAKLGSIVGKGLGALADKVSYAVDNMEFNEILDLINTGLFGAILYGIKKFIDSLTEITSGAGGFLDGITGILDGVRGSLEAFQSSLKAKTLLTIATAIAVLAAALVVLSLIPSEKLGVSLAAISALFVELSASMIILGKALGGIKMAKISVQLVAMAAAILILSSAMKKLADLDWEGIAKGTVGIAALAATLVIAAKSLNKSSGKLIKGSTGLIAFAAAILIMSKAVESMSALSWEELAKGLTGLTIILAEVVAVTRLMGDPKRMISTGIGMIALGAAMLIFAEAVERMGQLSWEEIGKGLVTMAGALTAITIAMNLLPKGMINKATGMVVMGAALLIIGKAVEKMGSLSWSEIAKGLTTLAGSLAAITLALNLMPNGMIAKATGLIGVAAAITILVKPLREMGSMSWEEIAKGLVTLAGSMTILAVALNAMQKAIPGAAAMMIVAPALSIMAGVLGTLGRMPFSEIGTGLLALAGVFVVLGAAALILKPLVPTMIGLGVAITLLGVGVAAVGVGILAFATALTALSVGATAAASAIVIIGSAILSLIPVFFEKIGEGIIALGKVIINGAPILGEALVVLIQTAMESLKVAVPAIVDGVFVLVMGILTALDDNLPEVVDKLFSIVTGFLEKVADNLPALIKAGADLLGAFLKGIFEAMGGYKPENLFKILSCITLLVASFAILAASKRLAKDAIIAVGAMALVMGIITALFVVIASLDIDNVLDISLSLSTVLLAISAAMVILSSIPIPAALSAAAGLGIFVGSLAAILTALGGLAQIPGLEWLLNEGSRMLSSLGNAIGSFVGNIIGGFMTGISGSFPQIGADLSAFMENVTPFIEGAKGIDTDAMNGVKALAETVLILTAAGVLDGLTSWLTGGSSMVEFGKEIAAFAPYFIDYYDQIKHVDGSVVEASANAAKALATFADTIPNTGGLLSAITGENSITKFAEELVTFGPSLMEYADSVRGLDSEVVVNSANAAEALGVMADKLPNQGGVVSWFAGENSLSVFAEELVAFGPALMEYANSVRGLDASVVVNSANAAEALGAMAEKLPNQGGVVSWFVGDNTLSKFAEDLAAFGPSLKAYADSVRGLDANVVVNSVNAAEALSVLADKLPNSGGIVSWFTGDNDIASFGTQLVSFGQSFAAYDASVSTVNTDHLSRVVREFESLVDLAQGIKSVDTSGMSTFSKNLTSLGNAGIDGFINAFTDANSRVTTAASTMLTTFINAANSKKTELITTFKNLVQAVITTINSKQSLFSMAGSILMIKFITGIKSQDSNSRTTLTDIISGCLTAIKNKYNDFYNAGKYLVEGFANGITEYTYLAEARARAMASAAARAAERELDINSPSKVGFGIGSFFGKGFVNALSAYVPKSYQAGSEIAKSAKNGLSNAISNIRDVIENGIDTQPTIRPVLDLSDVETGTRRLNTLFSRTQAMSVGAGINGTASEKIQNGENVSGSSSTYSFTQNNYSPKPLSRLEIYRQTKNQFSAMKGLVDA